MITIEIPAWAFWMLLSLFVVNMVLNHMLWRMDRKLHRVSEEHKEITDKLVRSIHRFFAQIVAKQNP